MNGWSERVHFLNIFFLDVQKYRFVTKKFSDHGKGVKWGVKNCENFKKNGPKSPHMSVLKPFHFILRHLDAKFGLSMLFYHL